VAVAVRMVADGNADFADAVLLMHHALLRGGEMASLVKEDVADGGDARVGSEFKGMGLALRQTKTGPDRWVEILDPDVQELVRRRVRKLRAGQHLFPFTSDQFRKVFKATCASLGLLSAYVPHSLRHGGA